jgi:ABC-type multidrug transport system ATPase subunit/ABC-type transporter Mla maintaining outer membrane lipid asymmetry permease subunit MlaE
MTASQPLPPHPTEADARPLVTFRAEVVDKTKAPFGESVELTLAPGDCVWLRGPSGRGKTSLAMCLAGLKSHGQLRRQLGVESSVFWWSDGASDVATSTERCGVLFQQTTLLDELTVAGNLTLAMEMSAGGRAHDFHRDRIRRIQRLLALVGLDYERDQHKMPTQLSGGMGRRAALAMLLAQNKLVIVLDEPFAGLDYESAVAVAQTLARLRTAETAMLLISHEPELAKLVLQDTGRIVRLEPPRHEKEELHFNGVGGKKMNHKKGDDSTIAVPNVYGVKWIDRLGLKLLDYVIYSLPLIITAFGAAGLAIAMLSADTMGKIDVTSKVLAVVDEQVPPLIKLLTGQEATFLHKIGIRMKVTAMLDETIPPAKAVFYAIGLAQLFVMELGPLLTALLLTGRLGGSYAGQVATLHATAQAKLLRTLGVSPRRWTLGPAVAAALVAGPVLTVAGTSVALYLAGHVGLWYRVVPDLASYWANVRASVFPVLTTSTWHNVITHPPIFHVVKAVTFAMIILAVAEVSAQGDNLSHRQVPGAITKAVVLSGLAVIVADWSFSRLLVVV